MAEETPELPEAPEAFKWVPWVWHHTKANREAFMKPAVWALVIIVGFVAYRVGADHSEEIVSIKNERITQLNEQLVAYKDRLQGATPDQAAKKIAELESMLKTQQRQMESIFPKEDRKLSEKQRDYILANAVSAFPQPYWLQVFAGNLGDSAVFAQDFVSTL